MRSRIYAEFKNEKAQKLERYCFYSSLFVILYGIILYLLMYVLFAFEKPINNFYYSMVICAALFFVVGQLYFGLALKIEHNKIQSDNVEEYIASKEKQAHYVLILNSVLSFTIGFVLLM